MTDHRIPLHKVTAHLRFRTGLLTLRHAYTQAMAQELRAIAIEDPANMVQRVWAAGAAFARGVHDGGCDSALSEP